MRSLLGHSVGLGLLEISVSPTFGEDFLVDPFIGVFSELIVLHTVVLVVFRRCSLSLS